MTTTADRIQQIQAIITNDPTATAQLAEACVVLALIESDKVGLAEDERNHHREASVAAAEQRAKDVLACLPKDPEPDLLQAAKAWGEEFGKVKVLATAKEAVPDLHVKDHNGVPSWYVMPFEDYRVLIACYEYDRLNVKSYKQHAQEWAEQQSGGDAL